MISVRVRASLCNACSNTYHLCMMIDFNSLAASFLFPCVQLDTMASHLALIVSIVFIPLFSLWDYPHNQILITNIATVNQLLNTLSDAPKIFSVRFLIYTASR